jgi:hypothetical protein
MCHIPRLARLIGVDIGEDEVKKACLVLIYWCRVFDRVAYNLISNISVRKISIFTYIRLMHRRNTEYLRSHSLCLYLLLMLLNIYMIMFSKRLWRMCLDILDPSIASFLRRMLSLISILCLWRDRRGILIIFSNGIEISSDNFAKIFKRNMATPMKQME